MTLHNDVNCNFRQKSVTAGGQIFIFESCHKKLTSLYSKYSDLVHNFKIGSRVQFLSASEYFFMNNSIFVIYVLFTTFILKYLKNYKVCWNWSNLSNIL